MHIYFIYYINIHIWYVHLLYSSFIVLCAIHQVFPITHRTHRYRRRRRQI